MDLSKRFSKTIQTTIIEKNGPVKWGKDQNSRFLLPALGKYVVLDTFSGEAGYIEVMLLEQSKADPQNVNKITTGM